MSAHVLRVVAASEAEAREIAADHWHDSGLAFDDRDVDATYLGFSARYGAPLWRCEVQS